MFQRCLTKCAAYIGLVVLLAFMFVADVVDRKPYAAPASIVKATAPEAAENVAGPQAAVLNRLEIVRVVRHSRVTT